MLHPPLVCKGIYYMVYTVKRTLFEHRQSMTWRWCYDNVSPNSVSPNEKYRIMSFRKGIPWKMRPLDYCIRPLDYASLGRRVPLMTRPFDDASLPDRYVPTLDRIEVLVGTRQFGVILATPSQTASTQYISIHLLIQEHAHLLNRIDIALVYIYSGVWTYIH